MKNTFLTVFVFCYAGVPVLFGMDINISYLDHLTYPGKMAGIYIDLTVRRDNDGDYDFTSEIYLAPGLEKPKLPIVFSKFSDAELIIADGSGRQVSDVKLYGVREGEKRVFEFSIARSYLKHSIFSFAAVQELKDPKAHPIGAGYIYDVEFASILNPWGINKGDGDFFDYCTEKANEKAQKILGVKPFCGHGVLTFSNRGCSYRESSKKYFTVVKFSHKGILSVKVVSHRKKALKEDIAELEESLDTMKSVLSDLKKEKGREEDVKELSKRVDGLENKINELKKEYEEIN